MKSDWKGKGRHSVAAFDGVDGSYSVQRLKTNEPLVPPKPNEFDRA